MHMFVRKFNEFQSDMNDEEEKEVHLTKHVGISYCCNITIQFSRVFVN